LDVAIHGQSFATAAIYEDLSEAYPVAKSGCLNIGMLHPCATGREGHDRYAPCSIEGLKAKGYDYWALGHIHTFEVLDLVASEIQSSHGNAAGRLLALRVELTGQSPAHRDLHAKKHYWTNEIRSIAIDVAKGDV
jgi:DNA repair exonuclease SbcCD nuclease subunit